MHIHILGIGGTFMAGLAVLASEQGHRVTGYDDALYPPMSTVLSQQGITVYTEQDHDVFQEQGLPDTIVVGNKFSRGHPVVEWAMDTRVPLYSGPAWLAEHVLADRRVIAVSGTHGKTTTSSMIASLLQSAGLSPGYLIGGVPRDLTSSAQLGESPWFVVEADEYDSAFFDKRPKLLHYRPDILIMNNLEFDHADIYDNLDQIERQFTYALRNVRPSGLVIYPGDDEALARVLAKGCWSRQCPVGVERSAYQLIRKDSQGSRFAFSHVTDGRSPDIQWSHGGEHNLANALVAVVAAREVGLSWEAIAKGLSDFGGVQRRMQYLGEWQGVHVYDDFAHHPTAIKTTLAGLRARVGGGVIRVIFQFASNTMIKGVHNDVLASAFAAADALYCLSPEVDWDVKAWGDDCQVPLSWHQDWHALAEHVMQDARPGETIVIMTNRDSDRIQKALRQACMVD